MKLAQFHVAATMQGDSKPRSQPKQKRSAASGAAVWITVAVAALYWLSGARTGSLWPLPSAGEPEKLPVPNFTIRMPASLDFGSQPLGAPGATRELALEVTAAGPVPLAVEPATLSDPESTDFSIAQDLCGGAKLSAQQSCVIVLRFNPKVEGVHTGLLTVRAGPGRVLQTALQGTAVAPIGTLNAALPPRLDFGSLRAGGAPVTRELKLEVSGQGSATLAVKAATLSNPGASGFTINHDGCAGATLPVGQSCAIQVGFNPAGNGPHVDLLSVSTSLAAAPFQTELRGTVIAPAPIYNQVPDVVEQPDLPTHVHPGGHVTEAVPIDTPAPPYPPEAIKAHREGVVLLRAVIAKEGSVRDIRVESGDPGLATAAVQAVTHWRYKPTLLNGQPIDDDVEITVKFTLKSLAGPQ